MMIDFICQVDDLLYSKDSKGFGKTTVKIQAPKYSTYVFICDNV